jgi:hypothetical protein
MKTDTELLASGINIILNLTILVFTFKLFLFVLDNYPHLDLRVLVFIYLAISCYSVLQSVQRFLRE